MIDDRICRITERDDTARRLSICADYLFVPGGFVVYVTYQAQEAAGGTRYSIDCHTSMSIDAPASGATSDGTANIAGMKGHFDGALLSYLASMKARIEVTG